MKTEWGTIITISAFLLWIIAILWQQTQDQKAKVASMANDYNTLRDEYTRNITFISKLGICTFNNGYKVYVQDQNCGNLTQAINSNVVQSRPVYALCMPLGDGVVNCFSR